MKKDLDQGIQLYREGRYEQALNLFNALDPESFPSVYYYLGLTCTKLKEYHRALENFQEVITRDFDLLYSYQSRMVMAIIYSEIGEFKLAADELDAIREEGYDSPQVYSALGHVYWQMGNTTGALTILQKALSRDPGNTTALNSAGYILADKGMHLDKAMDLCRKALEEQPENPAYLDSLGWVYVQLKRYDQAEPLLAKALELAPDETIIQEHYQFLQTRKESL